MKMVKNMYFTAFWRMTNKNRTRQHRRQISVLLPGVPIMIFDKTNARLINTKEVYLHDDSFVEFRFDRISKPYNMSLQLTWGNKT